VLCGFVAAASPPREPPSPLPPPPPHTHTTATSTPAHTTPCVRRGSPQHTHTHSPTHPHTHTHTHTRTHAHPPTHTHAHTHMRTPAHHTRTHAHAHTHTHTRAHTHTHTHTHTRTHAHPHTRTHAHTHTRTRTHTHIPATTTTRHQIERGGRFEPEAGRYQLYVSYACPWACRTLAALHLKVRAVALCMACGWCNGGTLRLCAVPQCAVCRVRMLDARAHAQATRLCRAHTCARKRAV
jgi:hypothetical protein